MMILKTGRRARVFISATQGILEKKHHENSKAGGYIFHFVASLEISSFGSMSPEGESIKLEAWILFLLRDKKKLPNIL